MLKKIIMNMRIITYLKQKKDSTKNGVFEILFKR
ncbi:hypothetical protein SAMN05421682_104102 [Chryseobacterium indoltheticum]|uniref:Uncharacterized protein n=1 Tax=Chryseobacterium indoltheticum TaxID=254 RepID=A0A381F494_9FLAO|nr:hypothetical protein SAMN05421682_104102 [Chryseobacterium indoltheticum]SUX41307.1 Uncharacterised protein [Chryseobacterium indoltheticum]